MYFLEGPHIGSDKSDFGANTQIFRQIILRLDNSDRKNQRMWATASHQGNFNTVAIVI